MQLASGRAERSGLRGGTPRTRIADLLGGRRRRGVEEPEGARVAHLHQLTPEEAPVHPTVLGVVPPVARAIHHLDEDLTLAEPEQAADTSAQGVVGGHHGLDLRLGQELLVQTLPGVSVAGAAEVQREDLVRRVHGHLR